MILDSHFNDWINLILRWIHLITGIAWIGSSFFFMWLDSHLTRPESNTDKVTGELWMTHSGGFYLVEKRKLGPNDMPKMLHWFKWEAAFTWLSGIALLGVVYYLTGGIYLIDPTKSLLTANQATLVGIFVIIASWFIYDALFESRIGKRGKLAASIAFVLLATVTYSLTQVFSGRGAFMHVGAILGTLMAVNVWARILPAQQKMVDATKAGLTPDYAHGARAKRRSVHNNYMTFPLLFIMFSNHFSFAYGHQYNWLVLLLLIIGGAAVKHILNVGKSAAWILVPVIVLLAGLYVFTEPKMTAANNSEINTGLVHFEQVKQVVSQRCHACHAAAPTDTTFGPMPAGVNFDDSANIIRFKDRILARAVQQKTMPLGNKTGMTDEERAILGRWIEAGARAD